MMCSWFAALGDLAVRAVTVTGPETVFGYAPYVVLTLSLLWVQYAVWREMELQAPIPPLFAGGAGPPAFLTEEGDADE